MATVKSTLFAPAIRAALVKPDGTISDSLQKWLFSVQNLHPLITVDTSGGSFAETLPPAGGNTNVGQSNQNQELTFIKISSDGNTFTLNGAIGGSLTLTAHLAVLKVKSDGTNWYRTG